jgi:hypothetical protein
MIQGFVIWSKYTSPLLNPQLIIRLCARPVLVAISLIGLWRTTRWGWGLALLVDGAMCAQSLWFLLNYESIALNPRWVTFWLAPNVSEFAALAVLLCRPVRNHFLGRNRAQHRTTMPSGRVQTGGVSKPVKPLRVLAYLAGAVMATCVATAFALALLMGQKGGGGVIFVLTLVSGLTEGGGASFLFAVLLTLVGRRLGPRRLWLWLLLGAVLAPGLIFALGLVGNRLFSTGSQSFVFQISQFLFGGPEQLLQVWWLTAPVGVFTAWICHAMYPWAFEHPT